MWILLTFDELPSPHLPEKREQAASGEGCRHGLSKGLAEFAAIAYSGSGTVSVQYSQALGSRLPLGQLGLEQRVMYSPS